MSMWGSGSAMVMVNSSSVSPSVCDATHSPAIAGGGSSTSVFTKHPCSATTRTAARMGFKFKVIMYLEHIR